MARKSFLKKTRVGQMCRELGCASRAFFEAAFLWSKKRHDSRQVSHAHSKYERKGWIPSWVRGFITHLQELGATALPA